MFQFFIEIKQRIDSRALWEKIKQWKVNLIDTTQTMYITGKLPLDIIHGIASICLATEGVEFITMEVLVCREKPDAENEK